ncbi:dermonecrotic toxin domain-containing protein [Pseudomonas guariconensis]|uniref:dermonecrotic toxin domain-containing protein n=1 Tax=Pseudomonas guariconensis TaxID=1288410 RepID=UPI0018A8BDB6|nr:DUF6543 domain-containing protein [Pseudomonas guariconensis]MBF8721908.1 hypothetical protein [Pseudomonas guariconensis]
MRSFDDLLDVLPIAHGQAPHDEASASARSCVNAGLVSAEAPIVWLNQLDEALRAQAANDKDWAHILPDGFTDYTTLIANRPATWRTVVDQAMKQQARDHVDLLALGSLPATYPRQLRKEHRLGYLRNLLERFGETPPAKSALAGWNAALIQRQDAWRQLQDGLKEAPENWTRRIETFSDHIQQAMRNEANLLAEERRLPAQVHAWSFLQTQEKTLQWLSVYADGQVLPGIWIMARAADRLAGLHDAPIVLWVHGESGGMTHLESFDALRERLGSTLVVGGFAVSTLMPRTNAQLTFVPNSEGLPGLVRELFTFWMARLDPEPDELIQGERLSREQSAEYRLELARAALAIPVDSCRQAALAAAERQWQGIAMMEVLPRWMLARSDVERRAYAEHLVNYHVQSDRLERWLKAQLPPFPTFAADLLIARLKIDKGITLAADTVLLERPVSVTYQWFGQGTVLEPAPGYGAAGHRPGEAMQWVPSEAWESVTLEKLASEGFDAGEPSEVERMAMANLQVDGITSGYLSDVLVELDPLQQYEAKVRATLDLANEQHAQLLVEPYSQELKLLAQAWRWCGKLSEKGAAMLDVAAQSSSAEALAEAGLRVHWLVITSTEELGRNIEGAGALVDTAEGRTLLYLPGAPHAHRLIERERLEDALEHLRWLIEVEPDMARYVADRSSDEPEKLLSYFSQAVFRRYGGYLSAPPSLAQTLIHLQVTERSNRLVNQARRQGRSQYGIRRKNDLEAHHRHLGYLRAALAIVPGVNLPIALQDIHYGALAIGDGWRSRNVDTLGMGILSVVGGVLDAMLTVVPAGSSVASLRRATRLQTRKRIAIGPFKGYEAQVKFDRPMPLTGHDSGTWLLDGEQYIWQDGHAYAVYRRKGEHTLRLKTTATRHYDMPVRMDGERWVVHAQVGLRGGGGQINDAEQVFASWGPVSQHPRFAGTTRTQAIRRGRLVLQEYEFPTDARAVEFAYAYLQDATAPAWARAYRRGQGTSGAQAPLTQRWQSVRWQVGDGDTVAVQAYGGEVSVTFAAESVQRPGVRIAGEYYPLLPGAVEGRGRYVLPVGRMPTRLSELDELIEQGVGPVRVTLGNTVIEPAQVVGGYAETFRSRLQRQFPGMAEESLWSLGEAIYRSADTAPGLTQVRLRVLERWLDTAASDPLLHLVVQEVTTPRPVLAIRDARASFVQLRWTLSSTEQSAVRAVVDGAISHSLAEILTNVITDRGYQVLFRHGNHRRCVVIFVKPGRRETYVLVQHEVMGAVSVQGMNNLVLLGDGWLDMLLSRLVDPALATALRSARRQGLLRPLLGGLYIEGQQRAELVWQSVRISPGAVAQPLQVRTWRDVVRPLQGSDRELLPGSGLYGMGNDGLVHGVGIQGGWLSVYPVQTSSRILLSRSQALPSPLTFDDLERCVRERFGEQTWLLVRGPEGWSVRRTLFSMQLDSLVIRARPGLTRQSAQNAARAALDGVQGSEYARLLHLEHVLALWLRDSRSLGELADPFLLLARQQPVGLDSAMSWRLALPVEPIGSSPTVYYLQAMDDYTANLLAAVSGTRLRSHAVNAIDDLLGRYGLVQQHRVGGIIQYHQPSTGRVYLIALQVSDQAWIDMAFEQGRAVLSSNWIEFWLANLPESSAQSLRQALADGQLVRLTATLRLEAGPHVGQVAVQRLADF